MKKLRNTFRSAHVARSYGAGDGYIKRRFGALGRLFLILEPLLRSGIAKNATTRT